MRSSKIYSLIFLISFCSLTLAGYGQVNVKVNLNVKHSVGDFSTFDRSKYITIHANQTENEWDGDNFTPDLRNDFLNGYDVYLGRDTGGITWNLNNMQQDPSRPGFVNPSEIITKGANAKNNFASKTELHQYEDRKSLVIAGQLNPFWTGTDQKPTSQGWSLASATATGEYMGRYINEFHGENGQETPAFVEIINEPAYESLGGKDDYQNSLLEIANFHNEVADAIRVQAPELKIGGYTTAFPDFEVGDFKRWENRWKLFMDVAGEKMDFWSIHLYDFPSINNGKKELRSGSNIEATFDMMEHYSQLSFNKVKPIVISEYGAQMHDYAKEQWSPYRDWLHIKASNSQLMSFLERPQVVASAINFIVVKAEWGYWDGVPYNHRLMRKADEPLSYTGEWVYTDMVKFYQLWKNVNGTRVDTTTDNIDIQIDAYVDGNKGYVILNNLNFNEETINVTVFDALNVGVNNIKKRHLTLSGDKPVLDEEILSSLSSVVIGAESTIILEYTFDSEIIINETSNEDKYYAETYYKPIKSNTAQTFSINNVSKESFGEAVLRIGVGRAHGKSLKPTIKINNTIIEVPENWRGYNQLDKDQFFGVLEIPVSFNVLEVNNTISVEFADDGGHISSVAMQVYNFSGDIRKETPAVIPLNNYNIKSKGTTCVDSNNGEIEIATLKTFNYKAEITGPNFDKVLDFSNSLNIDELQPGKYTIVITIPEFPDYLMEFVLEIIEPDGLSVVSKVNETDKTKVSLELSGGVVYFIKINEELMETSSSKIELNLKAGANNISVSTNKNCQGVYSETIIVDELLTIYPSPAENQISISIPEELTNSTVFIYNVMGSLVEKQQLQKTKTNIDISSLAKGVYFVKLVKNKSIGVYSKFIVK